MDQLRCELIDTCDVLPDSRAKVARNVIRWDMPKFGPVSWVPIFCANCGAPGGRVPEENCTFACYLCDPCAAKWGPQYGLLAMPDEVFWEKVKAEQLERYGHLLSDGEMQVAAESSWGAMTALLKESPIK